MIKKSNTSLQPTSGLNMSTLKRTIKWTIRAWPLWALGVVGVMHYSALQVWPGEQPLIDETAALACQLVGGLLVLISIDSNLGILRKNNLWKMFIGYLKRFPPLNPPQAAKGSARIHINVGAEAEADVTRHPSSVEEHLVYLQEQIDVLRDKIRNTEKELKGGVAKVKNELQSQIGNTQRSLALLEQDLDQVSVGGVPLQLFGVLLVAYGAITGYLV